MATVMKKDLERAYADEPGQPAPLIAPVNERAEMNESWQEAYPERFVVRTIDFDMIDGRLNVFFRDAGRVQPLDGRAIGDIVEGLINPPSPADGPEMSAADSAKPQTPLDLQIKNASTYVVFIIGTPSNMTFNPGMKAMTHKSAADRGHYGRLRHVNRVGESRAPLPDCRLIYFVADPPYPPAYYQHGFNLNVRLDQGVGADGLPRVLDIEIDPDIRYPGGSVTEEP